MSDYTIGIDPVEKMVAKMKEFDGWPIYKIKLGTDDDLDIVRALRRHTDAVFRIDANTAWTAEQTIAYAPELKELGVEFIEQPLARDDWEGMRRVFAECALPVIADESCLTGDDVARCAGHFHGINIKLTKAGGLTPARRMIDDARRHGLSVMVGCMSESSVGISAIAQLLPLLDYVDMDGALLIARDIATGRATRKGPCDLSRDRRHRGGNHRPSGPHRQHHRDGDTMTTLIDPQNHATLWALIAGGVAASIWLEQRYRWAGRLSAPGSGADHGDDPFQQPDHAGGRARLRLGGKMAGAPGHPAAPRPRQPPANPALRPGHAAGISPGRSRHAGRHRARRRGAPPWIPSPGLEQAAALMAASYIGGGVNFFAVKASYDIPESISGPLLVADNFVMAGFFVALLGIAASGWFRRRLPAPAHP